MLSRRLHRNELQSKLVQKIVYESFIYGEMDFNAPSIKLYNKFTWN